MVSRSSDLIMKLWIAICFLVLLGATYIVDPNDEHSLIFLFVPMIILSFPAGFIVPYIIGGMAYLLLLAGIENPFSPGGGWNVWFYFMHTVYWLMFVVIGYLQWFIFFPRLKRKVKLFMRY
ncbi:MAG: hypothetical protein AB2598_18220 [Candidatus Thiodiazotropha sp.]